MPAITFYQLDTDNILDINNIICDLLYKFYKNNNNVYILCPSIVYSYQLDEHIINYQETNFFPYQLDNNNINNENLSPPASIYISHLEMANPKLKAKLKQDILINLTNNIPENFIKYKQIIELVSKNSEQRTLSREHYKHYKKYNLQITVENLATHE